MRKMNVTLSAFLCVATIAWAGAAAALNPQPEPPSPLDPKAIMHNQQSEPPDPCLAPQTVAVDKRQSERMRTGQLNAASLSCARKTINPGRHQLNPQPLPPG
jgi:hypothetical protein